MLARVPVPRDDRTSFITLHFEIERISKFNSRPDSHGVPECETHPA